ncbi:hypothetical protein RN001_003871 [Aquatica leii]|uniref:Uncharacterized protein n=1 Tax=Aquatica leii TaxID=1421715 RepID=A0AAN7QC01_9COLE|nr:hypothetical protein RN001_003871 [Aquatica leii]
MANKKVRNDKNRFRNLKSYFPEFCRGSTIHGLKFLGENDRSILERIWWIFFIALAFYLVSNLIASTHKKWMNSPVIVTFATSETPIYEIPFPAVTICPLVKIDPNKFYLNTSESISDIALDPEEFVVSCRLAHEPCNYRNYPLFTPVLTSGGVCYSFNFFDRDDLFTDNTDLSHLDNIPHQPLSFWTIDRGYKKKIGINTYPRRSILTGTIGGLELVLASSKPQLNNPCRSVLKGYKVILHHPGKLPRYDERDILVPLNELVSVGIKPNMIRTSEELNKYKAKDRKCFLEKERKLEFFKAYDQQNCLQECLSHYALKKCDCVGFYMPRRNTTPICGPVKFDCLKEARIVRTKRHVPKPDCNCLPACYSLTYDTETSQMNWDWYNIDALKSYFNESTDGLSRLVIFYKDLQFMSSERHELYGESEFWANCGGLLGLFTGFSLLSAVEILYFLTLRLYCNIRKYGIKYWSGSKDLIESDA